MSVNSIYAPLKQPGNGVQVAFAGTWKILSASDLVVRKIDAAGNVGAALTLNVDYTVVFDSAAETFTVTYTAAPVNLGYSLITRASNKTQGTVWPRDGAMPAKANETAVDKLTLLVQELYAWLSSRVPAFGADYSNPPALTIKAPADRRAMVYADDGAGGFNIVASTYDPDGAQAASAASAAAALASETAAAASQVAAGNSATAAAASAATASTIAEALELSGLYADKPAAPTVPTIYAATDRGSAELYLPALGRWILLG